MDSFRRFYQGYWLLFSFLVGFVSGGSVHAQTDTEAREWIRLSVIELHRRSLADSIFARLRDGDRFQVLANEFSTHPSRQRDGDLGWVDIAHLRGELSAWLQNIGPSSLSPPLQQDDRFYVYLRTSSPREAISSAWEVNYHVLKRQIADIDSLIKLGNYVTALSRIEQNQSLRDQVHEFETSATLAYNRGNIYLKTGRYPEALAAFVELTIFARALGMNEWLSKGLGRLAGVKSLQGEISEAITYYNEALRVARAADHGRGISNWLGGLGISYDSAYDSERAETYLRQAIAAAKAADDGWGEALWWSSLAQVSLGRGNLPQAFACYDSALALGRRARDHKALSLAFGNLSRLHYAAGDFAATMTSLDSARFHANVIGDKAGENEHLGELGRVSLALGRYPAAEEYFLEALRVAREIDSPGDVSNWLGELGKLYVSQGKTDEALSNFEQALGIATQSANLKDQQHWLEQMGAVYQTFGRFDQARDHYNRALVLTRKIGDASSEALLTSRLAGLYSAMGDRERAIAQFQEVLDHAAATGNVLSEILALSSLGLEYQMMGRAPEGRVYLRLARDRARSYGNQALEKLMDAQLAGADIAVGRYEDAIVALSREIAAARTRKDWATLGSFLLDQGLFYARLGDYTNVFAAYDSAFTIYNRIGALAGKAKALTGLGLARSLLGDMPAALTDYTNALAIFREIGDAWNAGMCLGHLGSANISLRRYSDAEAYLTEALQVMERVQDQRAVPIFLGDLGRAYALQGQYERAIQQYNRAIAKARKLGDEKAEAMFAGALGIIYRLTGDPDLAIEQQTQALALAEKNEDNEAVWQQHLSLAKSYAEKGGIWKQNATEHYEKAVEALEKVGGQIAEDPLKLPFLESRQGAYKAYIDFLLNQKSDETAPRHALEIAERARARAFMELISRRFHGSEVEKKKDLLAPATFEQIQHTARRLDATVLEYFILDGSLVIWLVQPDGALHTAVVPILSADFDTLITTCYLGFSQIPLESRSIQNETLLGRNVTRLDAELHEVDFAPYFSELYAILFPIGIARWLPPENSRLVILPHRRLSIIPFLGLQDGSGRYLAEKYSVQQVPGVGVLLQTERIVQTRRGREPLSGDNVLLFGNPDMPTWGGKQLQALAGAEAEVTAISAIFKSGSRTGMDASEQAFKDLSAGKRLIHLATHGVSFDVSPLESFVALAPGGEEDGLLTAAEILKMKFDADLVVLSACETGLGKISGDGVEGLARSFMASGVPSVLVSLWNVDDAATRALMLAFYRNLNRGLDKAEALRQAQLTLLATEKWKHPQFWAAFVLYGERQGFAATQVIK